MRNNLKLGDWNVICDVCGFKFKASQLKRRWDGMMVCVDDWETRHPQTLLRVPKDNPSIPWSRPEPDDVFVAGNIITEDGLYDIITEDSDDIEW